MGNSCCCGDNITNNEEDIEKQKEINIQQDLKDIELNLLNNQKKIYNKFSKNNINYNY